MMFKFVTLQNQFFGNLSQVRDK